MGIRDIVKLNRMQKVSGEHITDIKTYLSENVNEIDSHLQMVQEEYHRVTELSRNAEKIIAEIDRKFEEKTKLNKLDVSILFMAVGLQVARQYLLTSFPTRLTDQEAAKQTKGKTEEHSDRHHRYYNPSLEEIITNPVPFDANDGANGALSGYGTFGHRGATVGHDCILGLIVGTANIATSTITTWDWKSWHVKTGLRGRDCFAENARTDLVLKYTCDKLLNQGIEGKTKVAIALQKELIHLKSDVSSKDSLPIPLVNGVIDYKKASELAKYGIDVLNIATVGKQATYTVLINLLIAMLHGMFCETGSSIEKQLYEVKTRKILSYSNLIASGSNILVSAIQNDASKLDVGGILVTIHRLIGDYRFISQIKREFLEKALYEEIVGKEYDFMEEE